MVPNVPLIFILLLVPVAGFIAWAGDRIGHKIGKRRQSLFGLRPRHTAIVVTIAAGMLIALASFGSIWASSATLRRVLLEGPLLLQKNARLRKDINAYRAEISALQEATRAARTARTEAESTLRNSEAQRIEAERKVADARQRLGNEQKRLAETERDLAAAKKGLSAATRTLNALVERSREQTDRVAQLTTEARTLEARRTEIATQLGDAQRYFSTIRKQPPTFVVNEEIERTSIKGTLSTPAIEAELRRLLDAGSMKASSQGAKPIGKNGRTVFILPKAIKNSVKGRSVTELVNEPQSIRAAAESIHGSKQDVAVLLVAAANAVQGEPVPVEFRPYVNRRVLAARTEIGRIQLNGTASQSALAQSLYTFLRSEIRPRLLAKGIIPPARPVVDGEDSIVSISADRWFKVLGDVQRAGTGAQVVVRAGADLHAADTVVLDFEVLPGNATLPAAAVNR